MDIYIKPLKKAVLSGRKIVYLKDIADVYSSGGKLDEIKNTIVLTIKKDYEDSYLISVLDVIKILTTGFPNSTINNVGEMDIIVEYKPNYKEQKNIVVYLKVAAIVVILFAGATTAIMSFHTDADMPNIFSNYYQMFFGVQMETPLILAVPYSLGLAFGIIIFFNHFSKIYLTKDPTPIEVQMTTYENETIVNIIDTLEKNKKRNK